MKKFIRVLVPLLLAVLIIASIGWYLFTYDRGFTRDFLLTQARYNDLHGNSRLSSWFYDLAYDFSNHDKNVAIELANLYKADGNYTKAEYTLTNAINSDPSADLFTALSKTYVEQDKLLDAVSLLDKITNPNIKAEIEAKRPDAPISNYEPGYYSQYIDVTLYADGKLYYTTDGEYPSVKDPVYDSPITLPAGETTIYAIAVDDNGLVSPLTVLGYTVTGVIEEVSFADPAMEAALRELTGTRDGDSVYTSQLWQITEFTVPEDTKVYTDLSFMPYLEKLTIANQNIDSLESLSSLTKLTSLDLSGSRFSPDDLTVIAELPSLTELTMAECGLSTIEKLSGAQSLTYLNLGENTIRNLDVLSSMTTLTELNLQHNAVTSLDALDGLSNLQTLDVSYNALTTLAPVASCVRLTELVADNNQITSLDGVSSLQVLSHLSVNHNALTDVSPLAACTTLTELDISNNTLTDISALSTLVNLERFSFASNQVTALPEWPEGCKLQVIDGSYNELTSLDNLSKMQELTYIYMDYNKISDINSLADSYCLVQVNVFGNPVSDVAALREHDIIVNYDPT